MNIKRLLFIFIANLFILTCSLERVSLSPQPLKVNKFGIIETDYVHKWDEVTHPFLGGAAIDIDQDGQMELFIGGGNQQDDLLLKFENNRFNNIIAGRGLSSLTATYSVVAIDMNQDGQTDLVIARDDGVYLYINNQGTFSKKKIAALQLSATEAPFGIAISDFDKDGDPDLYISVFVKFSAFKSATYNDPEHAKKNHMLQNNGDLTFTDITKQTGTASLNNTFYASFSDLNNDGFLDLVVAQNTGEVEIFKNEGGLQFTSMPTNTGYGFWMGLGIGDIDNDGDQDLFFSNSGNSILDLLTQGDIKDNQTFNSDWILLENQGDFQFVEKTKEYNLDKKGFGWSGVFEDINLDGHLDLLVSQNYIKWPIHWLSKLPGKTLLYQKINDKAAYFQYDELALENNFYGQTALMIDLNGDHKPDIVQLNMDGPLRAFIQQSDNNFITLDFPDIPEIIGTKINVIINKKRLYTKELVSNTGFMSDHTPNITFGLGKNDQIDQIIIQFLNGKTMTIDNPKINQAITIELDAILEMMRISKN